MKTLLKVWKTRPPCDFSTKWKDVFHSLLKIFPHNSSDKPSCQVGKVLIFLPKPSEIPTKCPRISRLRVFHIHRGEKFIPAPACPHNPGAPPFFPAAPPRPHTGNGCPPPMAKSCKIICASSKWSCLEEAKYFCCFFVNVRL